ncbi:MAG: MbtH family NRPS accessory protein [Pirellulaceae bacterium]|nr:MbtH family NRPS accessory protein [Pirellulaceae bacterium]
MEDNKPVKGTAYRVVVNHENQYSIWSDDCDNPMGWNNGGKRGSKEACLAFIKEVWTDMRPASLVEQMERSDYSQKRWISN